MQREERRTLVLTVTDAQKRALRLLSQEEGEPMAAVVRELIRQAALRRGLWPTEQAKDREARHV